MVQLTNVIDELDALSKDDLRRLRVELHKRLIGIPPTEDEFLEMLETEGKLTRPDRSKATPADQRAKPMTVTGEPLSETVIRERR